MPSKIEKTYQGKTIEIAAKISGLGVNNLGKVWVPNASPAIVNSPKSMPNLTTLSATYWASILQSKDHPYWTVMLPKDNLRCPEANHCMFGSRSYCKRVSVRSQICCAKNAQCKTTLQYGCCIQLHWSTNTHHGKICGGSSAQFVTQSKTWKCVKFLFVANTICKLPFFLPDTDIMVLYGMSNYPVMH